MDMDILLIKKEQPCISDALLPPAYIPDDVIPEILSLLSVKTIMRFKSVSKSWNTLISDPTFVQQHLKNSSKNPHLVLTPGSFEYLMSGVVSFPVHRLLQNPSSTVSINNFCRSMNKECRVIGSYNGLLCLLSNFQEHKSRDSYQLRFGFQNHKRRDSYQFCLWNPATGTISIKVRTFKEYEPEKHFNFTFGCDISTGTYKVVAMEKGGIKPEVRVLSFGDNRWKNIQCFPIPFPYFCSINDGVHLNGTVNWLALSYCSDDYCNYCYFVNAKQSVIVSLDLSTETYTQILLPSDLDEKSYNLRPTLEVLMDCLCFSHDFKGTELVIWQMKEFGVQESWTQLVRIDYCKIGFRSNCDSSYIYTISSSKNGDRLILTHDYLEDDEIIIYSPRDMRVERIPVSNEVRWFSAMNYVESLVSTCWESAIPTPSTFLVNSKEDEILVADSGEEEEVIMRMNQVTVSESDYEDESSDSEFGDGWS